MQTIGFVGLGAMGAPMARNLLEAGYDLRVYNRTHERAAAFAEEATVCETPRAAAADADAVFVMVTDGDALQAVLSGEDGVVAGLARDAVVLNSSTVSRAATEDAADLVEAVGGRFVDAPVSGSVPQAEAGTLVVLAGTTGSTLEDVRPLLEALGEPVVHCGEVGSATDAKLFVNLLLGNAMEGFAEALAFGTERGLDYDTMLSVVTSGGLAAPLFEAKGEKIGERDFEAQFPLDLLTKDLQLVGDAADETPTPLPATAATRETLEATRSLGHGEEDMAALVRYFEALTGSEIGRDD